MKRFRLVAIVLTALGLLLGMSSLAMAAGSPTNVDLQHAQFINNQPFTIPVNGALWYAFNYAGDRSQIMVQLVNGNNGNLRFDVWTPQQALDLTNEIPIGRGTSQGVDCDTGRIRANSACRSADLFWQGQFNAAGTYYVQVFNTGAFPQSTQLVINGSAVSLK